MFNLNSLLYLPKIKTPYNVINGSFATIFFNTMQDHEIDVKKIVKYDNYDIITFKKNNKKVTIKINNSMSCHNILNLLKKNGLYTNNKK